jgi:hypothetical protein
VSPLPGTRTIPIRWSAHHRRAATGAMNSTGRLLGMVPAASVDPVTGVGTAPAPPVMWSGRARVQALSGARSGDSAGQETTARAYLLQLDETRPGLPDVHVGWTWHVTSAPNDARLVGRALTVTDVQHGSERFTRDLVCEDDEDRWTP